jgi:hypothetical protein
VSSLPIRRDGSFSAATTQQGVFAGWRATFSYNFRGNFHSVDNNGVERAAGTLRETIIYNDGVRRTCDTDIQSWSVLRDSQPRQTGGRPLAGSYTGLSPFGRNFTFDVPSGRGSVKDVAMDYTALQCVPGGANVTDHLTIASIPVGSDGSFNGVAHRSGVFAGHPAKFVSRFSGHFHSRDKTGAERAAGVLSETITYNDGVARTCQSDQQSWTVTRS